MMYAPGVLQTTVAVNEFIIIFINSIVQVVNYLGGTFSKIALLGDYTDPAIPSIRLDPF